MTPRRLVLGVLTVVVVIFFIGPALIGSLGKPQITDRLQLYQTDLLLHASEIQTLANRGDEDGSPIQRAILNDRPLVTALEQYEEIRQSAQRERDATRSQLEALTEGQPPPLSEPDAPPARPGASPSVPVQQLSIALNQQQSLLNQLDVRIGILQAQNDQVKEALNTWRSLMDRAAADAQTTATADAALWVEVASTLAGLWDNPPRILPDAEQTFQETLNGWFRYVSLQRLYQLQQRLDALTALQADEQQMAEQAVLKLALVATAPAIGCVIGAAILIGLVVQRLLKGKQSLLAQSDSLKWETPWGWEVTWQVLIVGFFLVGQIVIPIFISVFRSLIPPLLMAQGMSFNVSSGRLAAFSTLIIYLLIAAGSLLVMYLSIKPYFPLPQDWFRAKLGGKWWVWGVGGYLVALPLVITISLLNQQIWQGRGGSNPLLDIVLREGDPVALGIFFSTAAIAAPVFEELLFRGFLLPSLTRYLPVWGAIGLSSLVFAMAHLSLSEVLPLTVLGSVLGVVYVRSRNLLAPMLVHSLWNSATMISLLVLGSSAP